MQQSINPTNSQTVRQSAKSINDLYQEQGLELFSLFALDRSDVGFAARLMLHWSNLDKREPTVRIVLPEPLRATAARTASLGLSQLALGTYALPA